MAHRIRVICDECIWPHKVAVSNCEIVYLPDESTRLWWDCPRCGLRNREIPWQHCAELVKVGVVVRDWSLAEVDGSPGQINAEQAWLLFQMSAHGSARIQGELVAACEHILWGGGR